MKVSGKLNGRDATFTAPLRSASFSPFTSELTPLLHALTAAALVRDLEQAGSACHPPPPGASPVLSPSKGAPRGIPDEEWVKRRIVAMASRWNLISRYTSMTAVAATAVGAPSLHQDALPRSLSLRRSTSRLGRPRPLFWRGPARGQPNLVMALGLSGVSCALLVFPQDHVAARAGAAVEEIAHCGGQHFLLRCFRCWALALALAPVPDARPTTTARATTLPFWPAPTSLARCLYCSSPPCPFGGALRPAEAE